MVKQLKHLPLLLLFACLTACHEENKVTIEEEHFEPEPPVWTYNEDSVELGTKDFMTFDIAPDYSELNERIRKDSKQNTYVENTPFDEIINIRYEGNKATVTNDSKSDIKVKTDGAHVTVNANKKKVACVLTGKSDNGSLKISGDKKVCITLNGVHLTNSHGPAINCQSKKECFIVTDSASVLSDDSLYAEVDDKQQQKGCIFSEGKLAISGTAQLRIIAKGADAIHSDKSIFIRRGTKLDIDARGGDAVQAKKNLRIEGGMLNILSQSKGASGLAAGSSIVIEGGRTIIISDTPGAKGKKNAKGIKCDSLISINNAIVRIKESSTGGKGIRAGHQLRIKNSIVDVLTFGNNDKLTGSKNKGVKGVDEVRIDSSRVRIRATNGWNEGLESRHKIIINYSLVEVKAHDDGISIGDDSDADIEINSGRVYSEAMMDAIDSNGTIHINGGLAFAVSLYRGGRGFDCDNKEFYIAPDATVVGLGYITSDPTVSLLKHPACYIERSLEDTQFCLTTAGNQDNIFAFTTPPFESYDHGYSILASLPAFAEGASYDVCDKADVKPAHTFHGLMLGGSVSHKSVSGKCTFNKKYTRINVL